MRKILIISLSILLAVVAVMQLVRPERSNPPVDPALDLLAAASAPEQVGKILQRSCYDCHSNQTRWPWYSQIAPVSWLTAGDVREGREHLNFSEWGTYSLGRRISRLEMMGSELDEGSMPPASYLLLHSNAALSESETETLLSWVETMSDSLTGQSE